MTNKCHFQTKTVFLLSRRYSVSELNLILPVGETNEKIVVSFTSTNSLRFRSLIVEAPNNVCCAFVDGSDHKTSDSKVALCSAAGQNSTSFLTDPVREAHFIQASFFKQLRHSFVSFLY